MNSQKFSQALNELDGKYIERAMDYQGAAAGHGPRRQKRTLTRLLAAAAVLALMVSSFSVGALAFAREAPARQETVELTDIGVTLILPDSWAGRYEVVKDIFAPYGSPMWEFCVKAVYDAKTPLDDSGDGYFYRGTLFTVFQCADYSMSAQEFAQDSLAGMGRYLFATQDATYAVMYTTDVQFDPEDPVQTEAWRALEQTQEDIRFVISNVLETQ